MTETDRSRDFSRTIRIKPETSRLAEVRRFVEDVAAEVGLDAEKTFDLKVAVSEACTNAVKHAGRETAMLEITASRRGDRLTFDVVDSGRFRTPTPGPSDGESRGLGLPLMVALMDDVRFSRGTERGTTVSLSVAIPAEKDQG
jgi:anti-sigma regulatory factor (Ser/Thr protein kinase)